MNITARIAHQPDVTEIAQLFNNTIQYVNNRDYTIDQIDDWSSCYNEIEKWEDRIKNQYFIISICSNKIVGFSSIDLDGYLDFMFVYKDHQNKGIGKCLLQKIENIAIGQDNDCIISEVSITARSFFGLQGYKTIYKQLKKCRREKMINFKMIKNLQE